MRLFVAFLITFSLILSCSDAPAPVPKKKISKNQPPATTTDGKKDQKDGDNSNSGNGSGSGAGLVNVTAAEFTSNMLSFTGTDLKKVTEVAIEEESKVWEIYDQLSNTIRVIPFEAVTFVAEKLYTVFFKVGTAAEAASDTVKIQFTIDDGSIVTSKLAKGSATEGQVMQYKGTSWNPASIGIWSISPDSVYSNDNVGIGTPTPSVALDVRTSSAASYATQINNTSDTGSGLLVKAGAGASDNTVLAVQNKAGGNILVAKTGDGGKVGIGTDNPAQLLDLVGGYIQTYNSGITCTMGDDSSPSCSSDLSKKSKIEPISHSLSKILDIEGVYYEWKDRPGDRKIGLIAQDVEEVFPEVVSEDDEGSKMLSIAPLVAPIIESIKELFNYGKERDTALAAIKQKNDQQQDKINSLQKRLKEQQSEIQTLKRLVCKVQVNEPFCY